MWCHGSVWRGEPIILTLPTDSGSWLKRTTDAMAPAARPLLPSRLLSARTLWSGWLNSGVPAPEVAARAGHSVDVVLRIYAKCLDGQESEMNARVLQGLGEKAD